MKITITAEIKVARDGTPGWVWVEEMHFPSKGMDSKAVGYLKHAIAAQVAEELGEREEEVPHPLLSMVEVEASREMLAKLRSKVESFGATPTEQELLDLLSLGVREGTKQAMFNVVNNLVVGQWQDFKKGEESDR